MNGVDWNAVRTTYEPRVAGARTPDEMRRVISTDARRAERVAHGHLGAGAGAADRRSGAWPSISTAPSTSRTAACESPSVVPLGPAAIAGMKTGDYILQVDGASRSTPPANLDELLDHTIGKRDRAVGRRVANGAPHARSS